MATIYNIMLYGGLALAVIFAVTAIVLFFTLKIPKAIGDVTGSTARKKIEEIREKGYESVQGVGISKKEAIKNHTTKISVRDVQSSESSKRAEKGRANYEKAVADIKNKKKNEDYLKSIHEEATDILHEDMQELARNMYSDEEATDVLMENEDSEEATAPTSFPSASRTTTAARVPCSSISRGLSTLPWRISASAASRSCSAPTGTISSSASAVRARARAFGPQCSSVSFSRIWQLSATS